MAKTMRYILRLLWLVPLLGLVACGDDFALSTKYYYVKPENKAWLVNDSLIGVPYAMVDNNGITYNFTGISTSHDFSEGMSGFFFIPTRKSYRENYHSTSVSNYGTSFSMYLYASYTNKNDDDIHLYLTGISIHCELASREVTYFGCDENNVKWTKVKDVIGKVWFGKTVSEFCKNVVLTEFIRGDIPKQHQLDMKNFNKLRK